MTDEEIERALIGASAREIADDGFSGRVLAALPRPPTQWSLSDWQMPVMGATVVTVLLLQVVPRLDDMWPMLFAFGVALSAASLMRALHD